jgi:hypothetical protein
MCRIEGRFGLPRYVSGAAMIPAEMKPPDAEPVKSDETQREDSLTRTQLGKYVSLWSAASTAFSKV